VGVSPSSLLLFFLATTIAAMINTITTKPANPINPNNIKSTVPIEEELPEPVVERIGFAGDPDVDVTDPSYKLATTL
jgi:hypothetical protein